MAMTSSLGAYSDVIAVLDTALRHDEWPVEFGLDSSKAAVHWRARANYARALTRRAEELRLKLPKGTGTSVYDHLKFQVVGKAVVITKVEVGGTLTIGGQTVIPTANPTEEPFALDEEDENLRRLSDGFEL